MSYINYHPREDAQDDTFKFLAEVLFRAAHAIRLRDPESLLVECDIMILTFQRKMSPEVREEALTRYETVNDLLYSAEHAVRTSRALSSAYELVKALYSLLCSELIRQGILLRAETDLDSIVARRSS